MADPIVPIHFYKHAVPTRLPPGQQFHVATSQSQQNGRFFAEPDGDKANLDIKTPAPEDEMINVTGQFNNLTSSGFIKLPADPASQYYTQAFILTSNLDATEILYIKGAGSYVIKNDNGLLGSQMQITFQLPNKVQVPLIVPPSAPVGAGGTVVLAGQDSFLVVVNSHGEALAIVPIP
jgi:hypothetical protein